MTVEARLADQELEPAPERLAEALHLLAHLGHLLGGQRRGLADPGGGAVLAEHLAQGGRPLAGGRPRPRGLDRRRHDVLVLLARDSRELGQDRKSTRLNSSHVAISYAV